jgi:hypothetical protein
MTHLFEHALLRRLLRQGTPAELGDATTKLLVEAIDRNDLDEAKRLARYITVESKSLHDLFCDWLWDIFSRIADRDGEQAMHDIMRESQATWMMKRTWRAMLKVPVEERVQITAEVMRSHRCGPDQDGSIEILEDDKRYSIKMDPCGSGGRMRRGDPVDGTPSRLGPPYNFGTTKDAHPWSFGQKDVPYYCTHCAVNETLAMEWGGNPLWVTGYDPDPHKPCFWHFYKKAEDIPEAYFERSGRKKPKPGEGSY